jgi:DeoR family fructose operon transcriptional repressor
VLADSSKYGDDHFSAFGSLADIDVIITDTGLDPEAVAEIEAAGPMVVLA